MSSDSGSGLHLEIIDGPPTQFGYMLVSASHSDPGVPVSQGNLCLSGQGGRFNVAGGELNSVGSFNASGVFENLVGTASSSGGTGFDVPFSLPTLGGSTASAGSTWSFQLWHREAGGLSNFSNGLMVSF